MAEPSPVEHSKPRLERSSRVLGWSGCLLLIAALYSGGIVGLALGGVGAVFVVLAARSPAHGLLLFGPFAIRELNLVARKRSLFVRRVAILAAVFGLFVLVYANRHDAYNEPTREQSTAFAEQFFATLASLTATCAVIYAALVLPTVVAEEREAKRLDDLLVTDLLNREILAGKLAGKFAVLLGYMILVVPVMALLTLLGGVEPRFVLAVGVLFVAALVGLGGVAMACSSICKRSATAVVATIALVALHQVIAGAIGFGTEPTFSRTLVVNEDTEPFIRIGRALGSASVEFTAYRLDLAVRGDPPEGEVSRILRHFVAGQLIVFAVGWWVASRFLRNDGQTDGSPRFEPVAPFTAQPANETTFQPFPTYRTPVTDEPVLWRESTSSGFPGRIIDVILQGNWWVLLVLAFFVSAFLVIPKAFAPGPYDTEKRVWSAFAAGIAFFVTCGPIAWVASRSIVRERQLDTLDALLITDLEPGEIFRQKWLAALLSVRYVYGSFAIFWGVSAMTGQITIPALLFLLVTTFLTMVAAASLGMLSSVYSKTANRAFAKVAFGWFGWFILVSLAVTCCGMGGGFGPGAEVLFAFVGSVLPPVPQVAAAAFGPDGERSDVSILLLLLLGNCASAVVATVAWEGAKSEFILQTRPSRGPTNPMEI